MKLNSSYEPLRDGFLSPHHFTKLVLAGKIVDGRSGGLVVGRNFDEGGICALFRLGSGYQIRGQLESGEFVVNARAAAKNVRRLTSMNAGITLNELVRPSEDVPELDQVIITTASPHDRIIYLNWAQIVVNREASAKHIVELTEMNRSPNEYLECDLNKIFHISAKTEGVS